MSETAEDYVVHNFVMSAVLKKIDKKQYVTIPKSCTTHALVSMIHNWYVSSDGNAATTTVVLFDFRKAFDIIDYNILVRKRSDYDLLNHIFSWISDFHVDNTTISEVADKGQESYIHQVVVGLARQAKDDGFQLNERKCKELRISFANEPEFDPICVNRQTLQTLGNVKLLILNLNSDFKWNVHVSELVRKVSTRLYFLRQLKKSDVATRELILFYITCIRFFLEYGNPVFHRALPNCLSEDLERLQKRAMKIIYPELSYVKALELSGLLTLYENKGDNCGKVVR